MTSLRVSRALSSLVAFAAALGAAASLSHAQVQPGGLPAGGPQGPEQKPEGVAEQAPKVPGALPTTPVLPPPKSKRKEFQIFELDGYFRLRSDWFKQLDLGFADLTLVPEGGGSPAPNPLGCKAGDTVASQACKGTLRSTNMRLRLEPTVNLDEKASVYMQVDVLDNLVLGSTPDGLPDRPGNLPTGAFGSDQATPEYARGGDSILVKRAWAEVMTPLGLLKFGRMPSHWGMGILANGGGYNPFDGTYDLDSDYGDTVDRLQFGSLIPGTELSFAVATDWPTTYPDSGAFGLETDHAGGQPLDLDDNDDAYQWTFQITRLDTPLVFDENVASGELGFNYGLYLVYRTQDYELLPAAADAASPFDDLDTRYIQRNAELYIPDVWFKLGYGNARLEGEVTTVFGSLDDPSRPEGNIDVRQLGGVLRYLHTFVDGDLELGLETGYASGDQWDATPPGSLDVRDVPVIPPLGDDTADAFIFDFDYEIDLILFRELRGAISNALYFRPTFRYDVTDRLRLKLQGVWSMAPKPVATPGNGSIYGLEFDGDIGYQNGGFFAGLSYGVLFPLEALNHPSDQGRDAPVFGFSGNSRDAETAQTFQARIVVKF